MPDMEAIGDAVTGGVMGRAVEPSAGEAADGHTSERSCLNCGCELQGEYCHCCGQRAQVHRTLGAFWHDLLHGVLHFEGKIWRTLPLLVWKPGELTRRYVEGQRARFVSPIALFLFSVFFMFAIVGATGALEENPTQSLQGDITAAVGRAESKVRELEAQRRNPETSSAAAQNLDSRIRDAREELAALKLLSDRDLAGSQVQVSDDLPRWLRDPIKKGASNPELLFYKLKTNAYKFSWALIPISVPFVWLLFLHRRRYRQFRTYDHTVFVTYSLSFMTLLLIAAMLLAETAIGSVAPFALLIPPAHMYRQLRGAYGLGRFSAVWRTFLLTIFAFAAGVAFVVFLVALGAFD